MIKTIQSSGKRKRAVARAVLSQGKGMLLVNGQRIEFFGDRIIMLRIMEPLLLIGDRAKEFDINVTVYGGGKIGQAEAARLAVARALVSYDNKLKKLFEEYDRLLLVADVRRKEPRKPGRHSKARAKTQKSYR